MPVCRESVGAVEQNLSAGKAGGCAAGREVGAKGPIKSRNTIPVINKKVNNMI